ncbi:hypothetical protein HY487_00930 [Candidatus Woesearchaeota archaeon]|nr:hypothetical protein [Candidatus Woesearchaeota archaeon]
MARRTTRKALQLLSPKQLKAAARRLDRKARNQVEYVAEAFENTSGRIKQYTKSNPERALMMAVGLGVVIGALSSFFWNRRNHR